MKQLLLLLLSLFFSNDWLFLRTDRVLCVLMVGVSCMPTNGKARTVVLFSRSLVTNVGSLSDLLGNT